MCSDWPPPPPPPVGGGAVTFNGAGAGGREAGTGGTGRAAATADAAVPPVGRFTCSSPSDSPDEESLPPNKRDSMLLFPPDIFPRVNHTSKHSTREVPDSMLLFPPDIFTRGTHPHVKVQQQRSP
jgi:hypothetical protein